MRKLLRKKEVKQISEFIKEEFIKSAKRIEELKNNKSHFIFINSKLALFEYENKWICSLHLLLENNNLKQYREIIVDKGAIAFIIKGADIMRPGITTIDENIEENEIIIIREETHNKIIAIGQAKFSGQEIMNSDSGKVIKNIHYVSDEIWNFTL